MKDFDRIVEIIYDEYIRRKRDEVPLPQKVMVGPVDYDCLKRGCDFTGPVSFRPTETADNGTAFGIPLECHGHLIKGRIIFYDPPPPVSK